MESGDRELNAAALGSHLTGRRPTGLDDSLWKEKILSFF